MFFFLCFLFFALVSGTSQLELVNTIIYPALAGTNTSESFDCQLPNLPNYPPPAVVCSGAEVKELYFSNLGLRLTPSLLSGTIDVALEELQLDLLDVSQNALHGTIPTYMSSFKCKDFRASWNQLTGSLVFPGDAVSFKASHNNFSQQLPAFPPSLEVLDLNLNFFLGGTFPKWPSGQASIRSVTLSNTNVGGSLPLPLPSSLQSLFLHNTNVYGSLPSSLPSSMVHLVLSNCDFVGTLPPLPDTIEKVNVNNNRMNFTLPSLWPLQLNSFTCENNTFIDGSLPESAGKLSSLSIVDNFIYGTVPSSYTLLIDIRLQRNRLRGTLYVGYPLVCTVFDIDPSKESNCFDCPYGSWYSSCSQEFCNDSMPLYDCEPFTLSPTVSPTAQPSPPSSSPTAAPTPSPATAAATTTTATTTSLTSSSLSNSINDSNGNNSIFMIIIYIAIALIVLLLVILLLCALQRRRLGHLRKGLGSNEKPAFSITNSNVTANIVGSGRLSTTSRSRSRSRRHSWRASIGSGSGGGGSGSISLAQPTHRSTYAPSTSLSSPNNYAKLPSPSFQSIPSSAHQYEVMPTMESIAGYAVLPDGNETPSQGSLEMLIKE